ncbi:NAD(P)/FAD-dependent oxidoreductase [Streptomyces sp. NPDC059382]|uniref:NAD(P)/FAD-dependent oxidoreductase n=1 Tax=Streptomyces sp. NPDC059382 TaxID=3346816 RepID=UPI00368F929C
MSDPRNVRPGTIGSRAIVIGGGLAGMLAAAALRRTVDEIWVVESDELPDGALPRKGLPQAGHVHLLWSGGVRAAETLLPGITDRWLEAGARRIPIPTGMVGYSNQGWFRRWRTETHFLIACSRDLLDSVVRDDVLADRGVKVLRRTRVEGLVGSAGRVTGVTVRDPDGVEEVLEADFVVDAGGRGSRARHHLEQLGVATAAERTLDTGLVYASRVYRAPDGAEDFPVVNIQADAQASRPGQSAVILPIEGDRWLVTAAGTTGGRPTDKAEEFLPFTLGLRHPLIGDLISHLEPLSGVSINRSTRNQRRFFEKVDKWPDRFVVLGDAVAAFNPTYGHGMSVAAQGAVALQRLVSDRGITSPGLARRAQRAIAQPVSAAWSLALGQDVFYPTAEGGSPHAADRLLARYVGHLMRTSCGSFSMTKEFTDVTSLEKKPTHLLTPRALLAAALGPRHPPLAGPPLTPREREVVAAHGVKRKAS